MPPAFSTDRVSLPRAPPSALAVRPSMRFRALKLAVIRFLHSDCFPGAVFGCQLATVPVLAEKERKNK